MFQCCRRCFYQSVEGVGCVSSPGGDLVFCFDRVLLLLATVRVCRSLLLLYRYHYRVVQASIYPPLQYKPLRKSPGPCGSHVSPLYTLQIILNDLSINWTRAEERAIDPLPYTSTRRVAKIAARVLLETSIAPHKPERQFRRMIHRISKSTALRRLFRRPASSIACVLTPLVPVYRQYLLGVVTSTPRYEYDDYNINISRPLLDISSFHQHRLSDRYYLAYRKPHYR